MPKFESENIFDKMDQEKENPEKKDGDNNEENAPIPIFMAGDMKPDDRAKIIDDIMKDPGRASKEILEKLTPRERKDLEFRKNQIEFEKMIELLADEELSAEKRRAIIDKIAQNPQYENDKFFGYLSDAENTAYQHKKDRYGFQGYGNKIKKKSAGNQNRVTTIEGAPLPPGGSWPKRSPVIKARQIAASSKAEELKKEAGSVEGMINDEGLFSLQKRTSETALRIIHNYIEELKENGTSLINKVEIDKFLSDKEGYYRELLQDDKNSFAKNAAEFIKYVKETLNLSEVDEINNILQILKMVADKSPQSESTEEEIAKSSNET